MGFIRHNALVVTAEDFPMTDGKFKLAHQKAELLFEGLVSNVVHSKRNSYKSFFIAPDGSKEGWDISDEYDEKRTEFMDFLETLSYSDGSSCIQYVDVGYDEMYRADVARTNKGLEA